MYTGKFPIEKACTEKFLQKIARVSYETEKIFFFGGKMLQRHKVSVTKHLGNQKSGRQNVDTEKPKIRATNCSLPHNRKNIVKQNIFWR